MADATERRRALLLHGLWATLALTADRGDRVLRSRGAPEGTALLLTVVGWNGLLRVLERRAPFRDDWNPTPADTRTDGALLVTSAVAALGGQQLGAVAAQRIGRRAPSAAVSRLGVAGGLVASLLASDLIHYSLHRLSHEWGPAWRLHSVHHSPPRLHILNATRFHPIEQAVEGVLEGFTLAFIGLSPAQHRTHATARATYGQLQHANIAVDSGPLDQVFATPDLHRWHHSEIYAEGDNNYGAVVSVWDRLLGTFFRPRRPFDATLGVGRMPHFPQHLRGLLATPFRWARIKAANAATWDRRDTNPDQHRRD